MEDRAVSEATQAEHAQRTVHVGRGRQSRDVIHLAVVKDQRHHHRRRVQVPIAHVVSIENENWRAVGRCPGFVPWITIGGKTARVRWKFCVREREREEGPYPD
jgi:hypothetical protein